MTLSTWQLIVVGALAAIWAVVLGVPLLVDLLRWLRNRPPASLTDTRPRHQRAASSMRRAWFNRPRPLLAWRSQTADQRRLQSLLACGIACVAAMFLAIALRGLFVPLFAVTAGASLAVVGLGVFVGARDQRRIRAGKTSRLRDGLAGTSTRTSDAAGSDLVDGHLAVRPTEQITSFDLATDGVPTAHPWQRPDGEYTIPTIAEITEAFETPDREGFMFEPLNLDRVLSDGSDPDLNIPEVDIDVPVDPELAAELGLDVDSSDPRFQAAPEAGYRQASARARRSKRAKARPIYIESVLDEDDDQGRAMND